MTVWQRVGLLSLILFLVPSLGASVAARAQGGPPPLPGFCTESDRFGVWHTTGQMNNYDIKAIGAGWYTSYKVMAEPQRPAGIRPVQLVRISQDGPLADRACDRCPSWDEVRVAAQNNPGSLWFIGNEPDRQDLVTADRYAELYHDFYTFLKTEDPSCQVAIGGVVQPTPIRLQYLDLILDAYENRYGGPMPIDVWNVHNYVLREGLTGWGCGVPPGTDPDLAIEYDIQDHDDLDYWVEHLVVMRQWMRERGYRNTPLVITEFGILMPVFYGYDSARVQAFMQATFDWLTTATDPQTGYPADGNRLVQAWAWYSLSGATFEGWPGRSHLFDPDTLAITDLGLDYGAYASHQTAPFSGTIDLRPASVRHGLLEIGALDLVTTTILAEVRNTGADAASGVVVRFARDGAPAGEATVPHISAGTSETAHVVWAGLAQGAYQVRVDVNPDGQVVECNHANNTLYSTLVLDEHLLFLPLILRAAP